MTQPITSLQPSPSPFQFDNAPNGEAGVDPNQIAVLDGPSKSTDGWDKDGFSFGDILDVVNPLQHIPVVSTLYRNITGDEIAQAPRVLGGALFGGPVGLVAALANSIFEAETGSDIGQTASEMFTGPQEDTRSIASTPTGPPSQLAVTPNPAPAAHALMQSGLFSLHNQPLATPAARIQAQVFQEDAGPQALQSAPAHALDKLIAQSQRASGTSGTTPPSPLPTSRDNIQQWMLQTLGKYETMPKG